MWVVVTTSVHPCSLMDIISDVLGPYETREEADDARQNIWDSARSQNDDEDIWNVVAVELSPPDSSWESTELYRFI